jgi:transcription termination factor Rho
MAKSNPRSRPRPQREDRPQRDDRERDRDRDRDVEPETQQAPAATAVEAPPAPEVEQPTKTGEDVASLDAETNAKYEQVKGGKLYIKDLQQMDVVGLHEIARQEGIPDYIGLKKPFS